MADLISRAAAVAQIKENYCDWCDHTDLCKSCETYDCIATIEQQVPAVDAVPVVHGYWVKMTGMMPPEYHGHYECSECQWHMKGLRNSWTREEEMTYCPNCGALMDGERRDDDA